jgi:hypothetical protein
MTALVAKTQNGARISGLSFKNLIRILKNPKNIPRAMEGCEKEVLLLQLERTMRPLSLSYLGRGPVGGGASRAANRHPPPSTVGGCYILLFILLF